MGICEQVRFVLLHLWDQLEQGVREQCSDGERDEISQDSGEKDLLSTGHDEDAKEGGKVNQCNTAETKTPHCKQEEKRASLPK